MTQVKLTKNQYSIANFLVITLSILYIYLFQMNYPFSSDVFLYGGR